MGLVHFFFFKKKTRQKLWVTLAYILIYIYIYIPNSLEEKYAIELSIGFHDNSSCPARKRSRESTPTTERKKRYISRWKCSPPRLHPRSVRCTIRLNSVLDVLRTSAASWLRGSVGFGSRNRWTKPYTTDEIDSTGFQSSLRIFRQTLPSRSMFGWYTFVSHFTLGGLCGYRFGILRENVKVAPFQYSSSGVMRIWKFMMLSFCGNIMRTCGDSSNSSISFCILISPGALFLCTGAGAASAGCSLTSPPAGAPVPPSLDCGLPLPTPKILIMSKEKKE